jgi:hypothetical protein
MQLNGGQVGLNANAMQPGISMQEGMDSVNKKRRGEPPHSLTINRTPLSESDLMPQSLLDTRNSQAKEART